MRKIQWRLLLPIAHVLAAVVLFVVAAHSYRSHVPFPPSYTPLAKQLMVDLNIPARLPAYAIDLLGRRPLFGGRFLNIKGSDLVFLIGVWWFWYLIGRDIDQVLGRLRPYRAASNWVVTGILTSVSVVLFAFGIRELRRGIPDFPYVLLAWAIALLCYSVFRSVRKPESVRIA